MYFKILLFIIFFKEMKIDIDNRFRKGKLCAKDLKTIYANYWAIRSFNLFGVDNNAIQLLRKTGY